jgi:peptidoglycan hydrolase-like protein with peptidoglycan-binding domain
MTKTRTLAALLALSSVAALPACSMFGGNGSSSRESSRAPSPGYAAAPNYNAAPAPPSQAAQSAELTPDTIRSVQQTLAQGGMYRGRVDGVWGPGTQAGVRSFQQQHNIDATGQLDQATLAAMNVTGTQGSASDSRRYGSNSAPPTNAAPDSGAPNYNPPPNAGNPNGTPPR